MPANMLQTIQKGQLRHGGRLRKGSQVHHLIFLQQQSAVAAELIHLLRLQPDTAVSQTLFQRPAHDYFFVSASLTFSHRTSGVRP